MSGYHHTLLGLVTQTSLHAGSGESDHIVDLPIQREAHTDWPCVFGSGVKGALRAKAETFKESFAEKRVHQLFGPPPDANGAHEQAGLLMVADARLVLLPVRSLNSHFRWVTCPAMLARLNRDLQWIGYSTMDLTILNDLKGDDALVHSGDKTDLYLEEYRFTQQPKTLDSILAVLKKLMKERDEEIEKQLTIICDDAFRHLCRAATPIQTHIRIVNETKTVQDGALWTEESLPPETLLYTTLTATPIRAKNANDLMQEAVKDLFEQHPYLQLGGNETTGMGWCQVSIGGGS